MITLIKFDLWLMRWGLLFLVLFAPIAGTFFYTDFSVTGYVLVFVMSLSLTQMDEKQHVRRFMLSLPLPLQAFFRARTLGVLFIGVVWLLLESIGRFIGFSDITFADSFIQIITRLATMMVLAPIVIAMFTMLSHPVLKWGLTITAYMVTVMIGGLLGAFMESLTYLGTIGYVFIIAYLLLGAGMCWLILWLANKIRTRGDLV
ncbi:hypothetical protein [Gracilibacillus timonensis]|uniref:hypothetical protein n=1 Tax=Gracilibacillus timonensis TaxID=1816696 RepID=UPI0008253814|nr:hypothetical protein [Gracilibacillus timonensis]